MLRSAQCVLTEKLGTELADMDECPLDPGGYFIVRGQEKVILVQEQLSKNRVIVEAQKGIVQASVTSTTHERKSKTYVLLKKGRLFLKHNILNEDIPIVIVFKALGIQSDLEILLLVAGKDDVYQDKFVINFEENMNEEIYTQAQALEYIGARIKLRRKPSACHSAATTNKKPSKPSPPSSSPMFPSKIWTSSQKSCLSPSWFDEF